jgi:transposase
VNDAKYIGLHVHQATISATVLDSTGKLVMESILETKAGTILQFIHGLRGNLHVAFEEGTCAAWLHDLLKSHVPQVLVCDPRKNALQKVGNKSDRIDSRKLAELLRSNLLRSVYHEDTGIRKVKELARSYMTILPPQRSDARDGPSERSLPTLGHPLRQSASLSGNSGPTAAWL